MKKHRPPTLNGCLRWSGRLLLVVASLTIAAVGMLLVLSPRGYLFEAGRAKAMTDIVAICTALDAYADRNGGRYPDTLEVLIRPDENGDTYLEDWPEIPRDPWRTPYVYEPPGDGGSLPRVTSLGRDGQPGGEGIDADIDNFTMPKRER